MIHDGSPEVLEAFGRYGKRVSGSMKPGVRKGMGYGGGITNQNKAYPGGEVLGVGDFFQCCPWTEEDADSFFYCPKTKPADRDDGAKNNHPTVKPTSLMKYLVRLASRPGDEILDPMCGSGSTGRGAILEGRRFFGIDGEASHVEVAIARVTAAMERAGVAAENAPDIGRPVQLGLLEE